MKGLPSSITAALLRAVSTVRSLKKVSMGWCDYGSYAVCVCVCVCVCVQYVTVPVLCVAMHVCEYNNI